MCFPLHYLCRMQVDYLIIGQGVCGTFLSHYLLKEGKSVRVIDDCRPSSPSRVAAGIINPVTGRRLITAWMIDDILPYAWESYQEMGHLLNIQAISQRNIIDFFPDPFIQDSFIKKIESGDQYVHAYPDQNRFNSHFRFDFGCGEIRPVYTAHLENLLPAWQHYLQQAGLLINETFDQAHLQLTHDGIIYKDWQAQKIIFCDGSSSFTNPYFSELPFSTNKGEALVIATDHLPADHIYKKSMLLVPLAAPGLFWLGASYVWNFEDAGPTAAFREKTEQFLRDWLKHPFTVVEHRAGIRPATLERRPFVGLHPVHTQVGILNGMGTKGCSLGPFFARQLTDYLVYNSPITAAADVRRFNRILSKG